MSFRIERINSEIQKILSVTINDDLDDPLISGLNFVITGVDCAKDLKTAKVYISVCGGNDTARTTGFKALSSSAGFIRKELAQKLNSLRTVPELRFILDDSAQYGERIDALLNSLKDKKD